MRVRAVLAVTFLSLALPGAAVANLCRLAADSGERAARSGPSTPRAGAPSSCPGERMAADRVITGDFGGDLQGGYVMVPFDVPKGTTAVRVKYCYDAPDVQIIPSSVPLFGGSIKHTLDLGLYQPRADRSKPWSVKEFRGWGGSSHPDVTISPEGFSSADDYQPPGKAAPDPRYVPGKTTRAFLPGPIPPGEWAAELGVAAVVPQSQGDADGKVAWRVEIDYSEDRAYADEPYKPAAYDSTPANPNAGWYAGDLHTHGEHSALGDASMKELFDFAFRPISRGGAGLDFVTLSDYVSGSAWGEVGRHQRANAGKLIARSAEIITYRGHINSQGNATAIDYRTGALYERGSDGGVRPLRPARPAREIFDEIHRAGGYTQINHPTIFPSQVPTFSLLCRGCPWDYENRESDYSKVDAIEVATGPAGAKVPPIDPGPNPFTLLAVDFYERALSSGNKIAAVGVSDSHSAGRTNNALTQSPIGEATTVVYAQELSEPGIECGVKAGHTYAKIGGNKGPDLRLEATGPGVSGPPAIMGDTLKASRADFSARVIGGQGQTLLVVKNGSVVGIAPVTSNDFTHRFASSGPGRYRLQVQRAVTAIETVSSPIYLEPGDGQVVRRDCTPLRVRGSGAKLRLGKRAPKVRCSASGARLRACTVEARMSTGAGKRKRVRTVGRGSAKMTGGKKSVRLKLTRAARREVGRHRNGRRLELVFVADDGDGAEARHARRVRVLPPRR